MTQSINVTQALEMIKSGEAVLMLSCKLLPLPRWLHQMALEPNVAVHTLDVGSG